VSSHHGAGGGASTDQIHLPGPSLSPAILGLGVTILAFGVLFGWPLMVIGFVILLIGLVTWLIDDARQYGRASDEGHH